MGITPQSTANYFGLRYTTASFNAAIQYDSEFFVDERSSDTFQRLDFVGKVNLPANFQLNLSVPYLINKMDGNIQNVNFNGIGDPLAILFYSAINTEMNPARKINHSLLIGAGVKLPLGSSNQLGNDELINRNFQLGTGSTDYQLSAIYTIRSGAFGAATEGGYRLNTENPDGYEFSDQINIGLNFFYLRENPRIGLLPFSGVYFEYADSHKDNGIIQVNSGGKMLLGTLGTQVYLQQITLSASTQLPIYQSFNSDQFAQIEGKARFSVDFLYQF